MGVSVLLVGWVWPKIGMVPLAGVAGWLAGSWRKLVEGAPAGLWLTASGGERLERFVLRNRRVCGRSDCPRPEIVVSCGRRPLPLREGGVPVVASPLGPDHAPEFGRLAIRVRHGWRGCSVMSREIEENRVLRFPELAIVFAAVTAWVCCSCVCWSESRGSCAWNGVSSAVGFRTCL